MKKIIKFSKAFVACAIVSTLLILIGLLGLFTKGINLGIDFQAGFIEQVRIAPTALSLTYEGSQSVAVNQSAYGISFVITGVGDDNQTVSFPYAENATVGDFASAVTKVPGVSITVTGPASVALKSVFPDSEVLSRLSSTPYRFHYVAPGAKVLGSDDIRKAISAYPNAAVQVVGNPADQQFQVRLSDDGSDPDASMNLRTGLKKAFVAAFGEDNLAVISTDFVGSRFSKSLAQQAVWLVLATLVLIWVYAAFRFRWDFAVGAVLAIMHDALIMVAFVVWTRMQFNSTTIAAILTIIGYSINDTVVVFDRIRENMKFHPEMNITDILDLSQTEILGRTIITTVTTMLAVTSLYVFTTGDMKDFALALLVGMLSGVYSTIYIASAFISFAGKFRKDAGLIKEKAKEKVITSGAVV